MKAIESLILSTLLQGAVNNKPVSFHWDNRIRNFRIEKFERGISVVISRKQFIKQSIKP